MNEILQKRIEYAANTTVQNLYDYAKQIRNPKVSAYSEGYLDAIDVQGDFLFREGANYALLNQWISVEEGLPEERDEEDGQYSTNVFARTKDCIRYAYYDFYNKSWCSVEGGYRFGGDVTHWMPIPSFEGGEE